LNVGRFAGLKVEEKRRPEKEGKKRALRDSG